jgi:hypothetical protein
MAKENLNYTEGNWEVTKVNPLDNWVIAVNLDDPMKRNMIANLYRNKVDANLCAAAPDMYEALKEASKLIDLARQYFPKSIHNSDKFQLENTCATIGKALAKVEGRE